MHLVTIMASPSVAAGPQSYYDILLLGKTGMGKSATGNKLLGLTGAVVAPHPQIIKAWESTVPPRYAEGEPDHQNDELFFREGDERAIQSITDRCKLLSNEQEAIAKVRVLDTPGFSDSKTAEKLGQNVNVYQANLQFIRWIIRHQREQQMAFSRVLYFLPGRGPLEKADRTLQEEIKVLVYYFGESIFYNMVLIATWNPRQSKRGFPFEDEDIQQTEMVFKEVMKSVLKEAGFDLEDADTDPECQLQCPPVVYISLKDTPAEVLSKVKDAKVQEGMPTLWPGRYFAFRDDICLICSVKKMADDEGKKMITTGDAPTDVLPYKESKCHPALYPKYTPVQKFFGGVAHIGTGGIPWLLIDMIFKKNTWPGWFNSDEICPKCSQPPGSAGCATVLAHCEVELKNGKVVRLWVDHDTQDKPKAAERVEDTV